MTRQFQRYFVARSVLPCAAILGFFFTLAAEAGNAPDAVGGGWLHGGVWGDYFNNPDLSGSPAFGRRDVRVDFDWGTLRRPGGSRSPGYAEIGPNNFSVRWTGQIMARFSENYTFKVMGDAGARLYLKPATTTNWTTLLDLWGTAGTNTAATNLVAGQVYDVTLEYRRLTGTGRCRLFWSSASTPEEIIEAASLSGINISSYEKQLWANAMDDARDSWTTTATGGTDVLRDTNGWPAGDAWNTVFEGQNGDAMTGTYLLRFKGQAQVTAKFQATAPWFAVNGTNYTNTLPYGVGYNAASNLTTATLVAPTTKGTLQLGFTNTHLYPSDSIPTGVAAVTLMRPSFAGSATNVPPDNYFMPALKTALQRYTLLRWILNFDTDIEWSDRVLPSYSTHKHVDNYRYWEQMVMLANETGKDLYACFPVRASNAYLTNVANLIRYGSDGVNPYTSEQANPTFPPLNPNLHLILEHENEVWNTGFDNYGNNLADANAAKAANTPDWQIVNYDGAGTTNTAAVYLRWHILRAVRASEIFRGVFGDAAMGTRVRVIYEYQYDNANSTASKALSFVDDYCNNADGTTHVAVPHPVNYYFWGGGGAVYFSSGNSDGLQTEFGFTNSGFELPALAANQAQVNPVGSGWTFTGSAGIYHAVTVANVLTNGSLGNLGVTAANQAYGCRFTVGNNPIAVYELGRWVVSGNSDSHGVYLIDSTQKKIASVTVDTSSGTPGQYVYAALTYPVLLATNATYYLVSGETAGSDTFYTNTTVTAFPGLTVNSSVSATYGSPSYDSTLWNFTNGPAGARTFGPVNFRYAPAPAGVIGYPPNPPEGTQAAFLQGTGQMSQTVTFPRAGTYAVYMQAAGKENFMNTATFYYDNTVITPDGNSGDDADSAQWGPASTFGLNYREFTGYSTFVFQVPGPGTHTLRLHGMGLGRFDATNVAPDTNLFLYFDSVSVISADALFTGGIPGKGEAFGQVASDNYVAQLFSQARYAQAYGLQVVAYEGGWSVGGDFNSTAFQNWCKYHDSRAKQAQKDSLNAFAQSGSRYYQFGTYQTWPGDFTENAAAYPLTQGVDELNAALPATPINGLIVPNVLLPLNNEWLLDATDTAGTIDLTGGWFYWNALVPATGNYRITATAAAGGTAVLEVDGTPQGATFSSGTVTSRTNFLTRGLHAIKLRSVGGAFTVTNVTVTQSGAPNAPTLNAALEGDGLIALAWSPPTNGPTTLGYIINYGPGSGSYDHTLVPGATTNCTLTGLSNGVPLFFAVTATNISGYSLPSNERSATPVAAGQLRRLLAWDFTAIGGSAALDGSEVSATANVAANGVQAGTITRGPGSPPDALGSSVQGRGAFNAHTGSTSVTPTNLAAAKAATNYFQFAVAPAAGNQVSLSSLTFVSYQSMFPTNNPGGTFLLEYSTNGFATAGIPIFTNNPVSGNRTGGSNTVTLTGLAAMQNVSGTVTFRLWGYGFGSFADYGLGQIKGNNDDLVIMGTVAFPATAPGFSPVGGAYPNAQPVTITSATAGASIRYTTNGTTPTSSSGILYAGPFSLTTNTTLKAVAYATNFLESPVTSAGYTIVTNPATLLAVQMNGTNFQLTWPQGTLLEANEMTGPWTTNGAASPFTGNFSAPKKFYRVRVP